MSHNQSRADKSDAQLKKPGRSGNSSFGIYHKSHSSGGGKAGGGYAPPGPSIASSSFPAHNPNPLSTNQSFKRPGNGQGGQYRVNPAIVTTQTSGSVSTPSGLGMQNGSYTPPLSHVQSVAKPADISGLRTSRPIPRPPSSQTATYASNANTRVMPAKGETANSVNVQFGSINPGFVNGRTPIPARTSSAPPNLDEQKHEQTHHRVSVKAAPMMPTSSAPKKPQVQSREEVPALNPLNTVISHPPTQAKKESQSQIPFSPITAQKSSAIPVSGVPMFEKPQSSIPFSTHGPQLQSQNIMPSHPHIPFLPVPVGTPQQNPQQMYYQPHMIQPPQPMIQQGHGLTFSPIGQLPSHMNMGMDINTQMTPYSQQQTGKYGATGTRRAVKITHPDTKEELRLGKRTEYSLPVHSQTVIPFSQNPNNFYSTIPSNSFGSGPIYYPNTQTTTSSQATRFGYVSVNQPGASVSIANPSSQNTVQRRKYGPSTQGVSQQNLVQSQDFQLPPDDITGTPSIKVSLPVCKDEAINVAKSIDEVSLAQKVSDISVESLVQKQKSVSIIEPSCSSNLVIPYLDSLHKIQPDGLSPNVTSTLVDTGLVSLSTLSKEDPRITSDNFIDHQIIDDKKEIKQFQQQPQPHVDFGANTTSTSSKVVSIDSKDTRVVLDSPNCDTVPKENRVLADSLIGVSVSDESSQDKPEYTECITSTTNDVPKETIVTEVKTLKSEKKGDISSDRSDAKKAESLQEVNTIEQYDGAVTETKVKESAIKYLEHGNKSIDFKEEDVFSVSECSKIGVDIVKGNESFSDQISDNDGQIPSLNVISTDPGRLFSESDVSLIEKSVEKVPEVSSENPVFSSSTVFKDQSQAEMTSPKTTASLRKKKKKEIMSKADAAGMNSDLYMAYKAPEEKVHSVDTSESMDSSLVDPIITSLDSTKNEIIVNEEGVESKGEVEDWEDAADMSTQNLRAPDNLQLGSRSTIVTYSKDFLMTFQNNFTDLPVGFVMELDNILSTLFNSDSRSVPNSTRASDRQSTFRPEKWTKGKVTNQYVSNVTVRDIPPDGGHGPTESGFRLGSGSNPGVLRHPRGQINQYISGNMLGSMHLHTDRWQRANGMQRGLIPSPQVSQVMHKAENKYEVGKISDQEEAKQRQLKSILNKLTPQNFDKLFAQVTEVNIDNADTLIGVISQIFDKALMEPTFCEMYSNFCFHLSGALPDFSEDNEKITFKRLLLNKCQEEFEKGEKEEAEAVKVEEEGEITQTKAEREEKKVQARRRMLGNIRLIGELYKKRMLTERIMHECIKKLITQRHNPDEEDIEALCKLLSTIGEMIDHEKARDHMNAYFDIMLNLSNNQNLSSRVRFMLKDAIDLRKNKWQQRRKVDGPKKIDEVHRDAVQERQAQASRLARGPGMSSSSRRAPPMEYGHRGSTFSSSHGHRSSFQPQVRVGSGQDVRMEDKHPSEGRTLSASLQQRSANDDSITLGPQGGLARGMSMKGQPLMATPPPDLSSTVGELRRIPSGPNGYASLPDRATHYKRDQVIPKFSGNKEYKNADRVPDIPLSATRTHGVHGASAINQNVSSETNLLSEDHLHKKSLSTIREYYSAEDEQEVILCIEEFKSPNFHPLMVSLWILDSFERNDVERDLLSKLLINICKVKGSLISRAQLTQGFKSVLSSLEDAVNDAPKATNFLGRLFSKIILENLIPLKEVGELICQGGEEPGSLIEAGHADVVIGSILENIKNDRGVSSLKEILRGSSLQLEDFRPPRPLKSANMLDAFL